MSNLKSNKKKIYFSPQIDCVKLDNEISLALESTPPIGPDEVMNKIPDYFNNDPFRNTIV